MKKSIVFFVLLFAFSPGATAEFDDVAGDPAREAVTYLQQRGVVGGFEDGTFRPAKDVTRAEFLKIALQSKNVTSGTCKPKTVFRDVPETEWYFPFVCYAANNGVIKGYADGSFRPHDPINYRDGAKIIAKLYDLDAEEADGEWYTEYVEALSRQRVMPGSVEDTAQQLSRGEMSQVIWGLLTGKEVSNQRRGELPIIASCEELQAQIEKFEKRHAGYSVREDRYFRGLIEAPMEAVMDMEESAGAMAPEAADDYSGTNVQEEGVDEADIVKNDGSHIFLIKEDTIHILRAYPSQELQEDSQVTLSGVVPAEMYVDGDRLTIISNTGGGYYPPVMERMMEETSDMLYPPSNPTPLQTRIDVYDITDRTDPVNIRTVTLDGRYISSRRIDDHVYVATDKTWQFIGWPRPFPEDELLPKLSDSAHADEEFVTRCPGIHYFPNFSEPDYLILAAINTRDLAEKVERETVLGAGSKLYASLNNMYLTRTSWAYPKAPVTAGSQETTEIFRFSLDEGKISFNGKGNVEGRVLNQFSMSESGKFFRIATQSGQAWSSGEPSSSRVTILDDDLEITSEISGIAPGENMKSARFVGDRAYLVTFKTVDPLFVISLDPESPKILGKLKIPGWSDYLHPYDENHLIGFGKEVDESIDADKVHSDNAVYYTAVQGMKLGFYDVTDPEDPKETHKLVIGARGTTSEVLTNHKALMFDKEKGILAFPITVTENMNEEKGSSADIETVFSGAQVYDFSPQRGFSLRGEVSHYDDDEFYLKSGEYFYGDPAKNISRMLYIGQNFFSVSSGLVKALSWDTVEEVERVEVGS